MSHHWAEWKYAQFHFRGRGHKHRVAIMVEAEHPSYDVFVTTKEGRTACGKAIKSVHELNPHAPRMDAYEGWTTGWRPCVKCFPNYDLRTFDRMNRIMIDSWERGEFASDRAWHWLWYLVMAKRRARGET